MATVTSSRGDTALGSARRTEPRDVPGIVSLFSPATGDVFGRVDVAFLLEKSNLALTLCNEKNEVIAHAAFLDYPNWNITDQADWEPFLHDNYTHLKCTPLNTLFVHLFVAKEEYAAGCSQEIVRKAFILLPELQFILLFIPAEENLGAELGAVFEVVPALPVAVGAAFTLCVCPRHRCHPQLWVRQARLEDYDDLMLIWTPQSETLKKTYGEYSLVDLIERQGEEDQAAVCEVGGIAVGFMSLRSQADVSLFQECFDLGPFHGLCKPHPEDVLKVPHKSSVQEGEDGSTQTSQTPEPLSSADFESIPGEEAAVQGHEATAVPQTELPLDNSSITDFKPSTTCSFDTEEEGDFHPVYRGASNAFCIRLFFIDEEYESRSLDFLQYAFGVFPDKDFCVLVVPPEVPELPLVQGFARAVPVCPVSPLGCELYVSHRAALLTSFNVRKTTTDDLLGVKVLIQSLSLNERIWEDCRVFTEARRDPDGMPVQAFVAEVSGQIVGISVIRDEMDIEYIRSHYNIEDFMDFNCYQQEEHGHLCHFVLNPVFQHYTKHFLKEILRLAHKSALYYPIYSQYVEGKLQSPCAHSLTSALHCMAPVRPRRQIVCALQELGGSAPAQRLPEDQLSYSLCYTSRKLVLESKVSINIRIVVVGASDVGISFLETLIFWPRLKFNNLTLISVHGLPGKASPVSKHRRFLINSHCFNDEDYAQMSLCSWVNVVVGKMTGINRAAKYVVVSKEKKVPYDYLVLCTGQSYQAVAPTGADISELPTNREVMSKWPQRHTGKVPPNHFTLNDDQDCARAVQWLQENLVSSTGNVIVYGNTIDIYTTVETLLSLGIDGPRIQLVQPPLSPGAPCLQEAEVEGAVQEALARAGVAVHRDSVLAQWGQGSHPHLITWAAFTTATSPLTLQCSAFFSFAYKAVDYETFKAINDACLVFDGRLVIDAKFHTNDVSIRAAGPLTKFSRRYYREEWTHSNFNSKEIGSELAASMRSLLDPTCQPRSEAPEGSGRLIPVYKGCKVQGGVLPGGYNYLHISKPAVPIHLPTELAPCDRGMEIITGKAAHGNYFRLHLNRHNVVDSITCLSKEPVPVSNYLCLYGQHERLLNDLCHRRGAGQLTDLYSYFREPWCMAIYHDRFIDLQKELRQILMAQQVRK
ncbi:CFA61 protein, partial [Serilophus lunatus]|nr:CFA61 protein [Serilophus lunatus]